MTNSPAYAVDGRPQSAEAFYAVACDPLRSVVVEACAGAGKTWMLVSRILRALLAGAEPEHILAITFTRKAAGEMRERLDEWLASLAAPMADDADRVAALLLRGLDAAQARTLAPTLGGLHQRLLRSGRAVQVRTFHGWFAQLATHAPLELLVQLGLPQQMQLIEDTEELRVPLMRQFHAVVDADLSLRQDYLAIVQQHRRSMLLQWLDVAWKKSADIAAADAAGTLADAVPPAAALYPECAPLADPRELCQREPLRSQLDLLAQVLGRGKAKPAEAAERLRRALDEPDAVAAFAIARQALFTKDLVPRVLGDVAGLPEAVGALAHIAQMVAQQQAHLDHGRMLRLSRVLLVEFAALKRRRGLVDMPDLERAALSLLSDPVLSGWLQERLDLQIRHLLIDEFQDTSPLQWHALHGWLSAYAGAGGGTSGQRPPSVFIVGDPKQSIYRFRRAEPRVFDAAKEFVSRGLRGSLLACDHTWRCSPAVLDTLNAVFQSAAQTEGWTPFRAHTTAAVAPGALLKLPEVLRPAARSHEPVDDTWRDSLTEPRTEPEELLRLQEAHHVATAVAQILGSQGLRPGEVMVLARRRSALRLVAQALAHRQLPYVVPEALLLAESPEVLDLMAVLDVLASPGHDIALARALKSPLFGAADGDLLWLAQKARAAQQPWLMALVAVGDGKHQPPALQRAAELLAAWAAAMPGSTPHEALDRIVDEGELRPRLSAAVPAPSQAGALKAVDALLTAALDWQGGRYATLYGFVRAVRSGQLKAAAPMQADAVQLLTVHGAKGLEARAVFLVDTDPLPRQQGRATLLVDWPVHSAAPRRVAFVAHEAATPPSLHGLMAEELTARQREELNALYVAMTRAQQWLLISRTAQRGAGRVPSWWQRLAPHANPFLAGEGVVTDTGSGHDAALVDVLPQLKRAQVPVSPVDTGTADAGLARLGQAIHRMLEWAGRADAPQPASAWPALAAAAAVSFGLGPAAAPQVLGAASAILLSPACGKFFCGPGLLWAGNEVPLAWQGGPLRLDRLVLLDDGSGPEWWVLDYKLHAAPAQVTAYRDQLQSYALALRDVVPGEVVRIAFITAGGALHEV